MNLNGMHCKAGVDREPLEPCSQTELSWPLTPTCPGSVGSTRIMLTREEEYKKEYIKKETDSDGDKGKNHSHCILTEWPLSNCTEQNLPS